MNIDSAKAIDLVNRYAFHTKEIKRLTRIIKNNFDLCPGIDAKNVKIYTRDFDANKQLHISDWYRQARNLDVDVIGENQHKECKFCYDAHLAIQERKFHKKKLSGVKSSMTRIGSK